MRDVAKNGKMAVRKRALVCLQEVLEHCLAEGSEESGTDEEDSENEDSSLISDNEAVLNRRQDLDDIGAAAEEMLTESVVCDQVSVVVLLWGIFSPNLGILSIIHFGKVTNHFQCRIYFSFCHKRDCLCPILTQSNVNNVRWCLLFSRVFVVF